MCNIDPSVRRLLAQRCRSSRTRRADFTKEAPVKWRPTTLRNPNSEGNDYFTPEAAWIFIAECLEAGVELYPIALDHPPGKTAYYFVVPGHPPVKAIYVKLQLRSDHVLCRSFHESESRS
jgi:hypothetical protein